MSGHSKWATIKRKKGKADAARGRMFTRLIREITVAAREGGSDIETNPRLRTAVNTAKAANMPQDNIKKAIQKGTGELPGTQYEEAAFEGYGPGGVAVYVEALTDNRNRIVAEIRHIFSKFNGNLGENGCVSWMFDKKGVITVSNENVEEDDLIEASLEAGAADVQEQEDAYEVYTEANDLNAVRQALEDKSYPIISAEFRMIPQNTIKLDEKGASSMLKLMEALDENDDVQRVSANFDIDDELMEQLSA
jgi:YebC/PmpR family DNA-binding regulatory protein